ncbi:hypothetical protein BC829DRAFT_170918 [Chytridium lagenaria]|nr:hypothetical protein BC829DRAFT_170918 [Chytridium lagenaria]
MHGGIHAREWISPAVVTYIAHHLTTSPFRFLYTFHIIPILNVDGYNYSRTVDRFWRKNRQRNEGSSCVGTDINRNFGYNWGTAGASSEPCSQTYHGPSSFSSPESKALSTYIQSLPNVVSYIDFHSYSQLWLFPNTLSCNTPIPDFDLLSRAATLITTSLKSLYGTTYVSGDACNTIYPASGNTIDWTYGVANVTFSFAVELRDDGTYGFELPQSMIKATGEETVEGLKALWGFMEGYYNGSIKAEGVEKGKKSSASKGLGWGGVWMALLLALWW